jgi:hypothetical protein
LVRLEDLFQFVLEYLAQVFPWNSMGHTNIMKEKERARHRGCGLESDFHDFYMYEEGFRCDIVVFSLLLL